MNAGEQGVTYRILQYLLQAYWRYWYGLISVL